MVLSERNELKSLESDALSLSSTDDCFMWALSCIPPFDIRHCPVGPGTVNTIFHDEGEGHPVYNPPRARGVECVKSVEDDLFNGKSGDPLGSITEARSLFPP